jgi:Icc-related predicted phosphoesterase
MRILAIGDPHGNLDKIKQIPVKEADLILLTGNLGKSDLMRRIAFENAERKKRGLQEKEYSPAQEKRAFMEAYTSTMRIVKYLARFAPVFTIFGNVESSNYETRQYSKKIGLSLPLLYNDLSSMHNVRIINNKVANFEGIRIGGLEYFIDTSWIREFKPSDFKERMAKAKKETGKARRILSHFGKVDILLCHQPPYHVLDEVTFKGAPKHWLGKHAGSKTIYDYIKKYQPRYVFCGHMHEDEGMKKVGETEVYNLGVAGYKVISL